MFSWSRVPQHYSPSRPPRGVQLAGVLGLAAAALLANFVSPSPAAPPADAQEAQQGTAAADAFQPDTVLTLLELLVDADPDSAGRSLRMLREKIRQRELQGARLDALRPRLTALLNPLQQAGAEHPLYWEAVLLAASWGDKPALHIASAAAQQRHMDVAVRIEAIESLVSGQDIRALEAAIKMCQDPDISMEHQGRALAALGGLPHDDVAVTLLDGYAESPPPLQLKIIELLTQRASWSKRLLQAIEQDRLPAQALNANQVLRLQNSPDQSLRELARTAWGTVRTERNPQREQTIAQVRELLGMHSGDPERGQLVFRRVCAQCHKIFGEGQEVGPDLTSNGRGSLEQLLSNVLDPSLVIGAAYQARVAVTADGRVLTGLVVEQSDERLVLKVPGGKEETIAADDIEELHVSQLSLMPEGLEQQLQPQEIVDLFAFLQVRE